VLARGTIQRDQVDQRDPVIVRFEQHAFDLSRLSSGVQNITFSVQERYPWELLNPPPDDPLFKLQAGAFRSELHNRITAPFYPIAFLIVTFAYLGAPRTTRQSRAMSLVGAIVGIAVLRTIGFVGTLAGSSTPLALLIPYAAILITVALGIWGITRGVIIEPPECVSRAVGAVVEAVMRRTSRMMGQTS
jgi:lipopolysaccharide export system permease protein